MKILKGLIILAILIGFTSAEIDFGGNLQTGSNLDPQATATTSITTTSTTSSTIITTSTSTTSTTILFYDISSIEISSCISDELCIGKNFNIQVALNINDSLIPCQNCNCTIDIVNPDGSYIVKNHQLNYTHNGFFTYKIIEDYNPDQEYSFQTSCYYNNSLMGSVCYDMLMKECLEDPFKVQTPFDITDDVNDYVGGGVEGFFGYLGLEEIGEEFKQNLVATTGFITKINTISEEIAITGFWFISQSLQFSIDPIGYVNNKVVPYLMEIGIIIIYTNFLLFVIYEIFAMTFVISRHNSKDLFVFMESYIMFHIKTLEWVFDQFIKIFNIFMRIAELFIRTIDGVFKFWA